MSNLLPNPGDVIQPIKRVLIWMGSKKGLIVVYLIAMGMYSVFLFSGLSAKEARSDFTLRLSATDRRLDLLRDEFNETRSDFSNVVENMDAMFSFISQPEMDMIKELIDLHARLQTPGAGMSLVDLGKLNEQMKLMTSEMSDIRGALNPTDPTAVITVARLGDKVAELTQSFSGVEQSIDDIETDLDAKLLRNFEQMDNQVDRIVGMLKWLGLLMIPFIINLIKGLMPSKEADAPVATPPSS